ncbi:MAG: thiamine diphosphokinase [Pseudomonadota bacterium]
MDQSNVQSQKGVTLVGGGDFDGKDLVESMALAPVLVAADGGSNACFRQGVVPVAVIGDFDSILPRTRAAFPETKMIEVAEQDSTDFEKSLSRIDAPFVVAVGFTGKRLDHTLAVLSVMARRVGPPVILLGPDDVTIWVEGRFSVPVAADSRVSLYPLAKVTGRSKGLRWPIDGLTLAPLGQISTSNQATGPVTVEIDKPGCAIILPRSALELTLAAISG